MQRKFKEQKRKIDAMTFWAPSLQIAQIGVAIFANKAASRHVDTQQMHRPVACVTCYGIFRVEPVRHSLRANYASNYIR